MFVRCFWSNVSQSGVLPLSHHDLLLFLFFLASSLLFKNSPNISAAATASSSDESMSFVYVLLVPVCVMCVSVAGTSWLVPATGNCLLVPATGTRNRSVWHLLYSHSSVVDCTDVPRGALYWLESQSCSMQCTVTASSFLAANKWFEFTAPVLYSQTHLVLQYGSRTAECEGLVVIQVASSWKCCTNSCHLFTISVKCRLYVHLVNNVGHFIVHPFWCKPTIIAGCRQTLAPGLLSIAEMAREKFCVQLQCASVLYLRFCKGGRRRVGWGGWVAF